MPFIQIRKKREHVVECPAPESAGALEAKLEILTHGQIREDLAILRHIAEPKMGDLVGPQANDRAATIDDPALRRD